MRLDRSIHTSINCGPYHTIEYYLISISYTNIHAKPSRKLNKLMIKMHPSKRWHLKAFLRCVPEAVVSLCLLLLSAFFLVGFFASNNGRWDTSSHSSHAYDVARGRRPRWGWWRPRWPCDSRPPRPPSSPPRPPAKGDIIKHEMIEKKCLITLYLV